MKRSLACAGLTMFLAGLLPMAPAQDAPDAPVVAAAEREEREANTRRINTKVEQLEETLQSQQKRIAALVDQIHSLREELDRLKSRNESAATQESIRRLADKIEEVDKKRQADNELVLAQLKTIGKTLSKPITPREPIIPPAASRPDKVPPPADTAPPENGYTYKIKDNDTLVRIVKDLNAQGFKVTQKQVMDANPKVNWSRLRVGQPIFIPQPGP
jgi:LysM repeat protein